MLLSFVCSFVVAAASAAAAQDWVSGPALVPVKVAIVSRTVFYVPLWIAARAGLFRGAGLDVSIEVFDNAEKISDALRSGAVQIAISTPEGAILDALRGGNQRIVAGNAEKLPHFVIAKPSIATPEQLRGATFGVLSLNEGTTYLVHAYARSVGLREGDYQIKQVGGAPTRWRLLKEGVIDVGLQPFPLSYEAEAAGFNNLGPLSRVVPEWQFTSVNVDRRWAEANRATVGRFLRALAKGQGTMQSQPDLAIEIAAAELRTSPELARRALDDTRALRILSADLSPSREGLRMVFQSLIATNQLPHDAAFDMARFVDVSYLE
ncbi:MAG: ABC transporter substrate-binding protein [Alphaproteobacteria bacterium]|nr:MAG: ABC transporter substrate-binding protein [Alphaproteobacteria bacterium]